MASHIVVLGYAVLFPHCDPVGVGCISGLAVDDDGIDMGIDDSGV